MFKKVLAISLIKIFLFLSLGCGQSVQSGQSEGSKRLEQVKCFCAEKYSSKGSQKICLNEQLQATKELEPLLKNVSDEKAIIISDAMKKHTKYSSKCGYGYDYKKILYEIKNN